MKYLAGHVAAIPILVLTISSSPALAQHGHQCAPDAVAQPLLSVADYDGSGQVKGQDVKMSVRTVLRHVLFGGDYVALFDRNADDALSGVDILYTVFDLTQASTALDQEIAEVYWATEHLRDQQAAIAEGFIPFTQEFMGHGFHWARHIALGSIDYAFDHADPEGLNYGADGDLWAVFYYNGPGPTNTDPDDIFNPFAMAPEGFTGDHDMWHHHAGSCFGGLDYANPSYDPTTLDFHECTTPAECFAITGSTSTVWNPKFHMLHLWLYKLNPCGTFAGAHPGLMTGQDPGTTTDPHGDTCDVFDVLPT